MQLACNSCFCSTRLLSNSSIFKLRKFGKDKDQAFPLFFNWTNKTKQMLVVFCKKLRDVLKNRL